jgi:hypothetical protein
MDHNLLLPSANAPGRCRGYQGKRKLVSELSTNPHSIKRQKRDEVIMANQISKEIELAKRADRSARSYAFLNLKKTQAYKDATDGGKKEMEEEERRRVERKR